MIPDIHPQSMGPLALKGTLPDVGHLATWTVSSHKPGFDVNCLRDDDPETFWQLSVSIDCSVFFNTNGLSGAMALNLTISLSNSRKKSLYR